MEKGENIISRVQETRKNGTIDIQNQFRYTKDCLLELEHELVSTTQGTTSSHMNMQQKNPMVEKTSTS